MKEQGKGKRTGIDFSNHELLITENELVTIHELKKPNTIVHSVKFINVEGSLIVKGDFGNWIFCRSFMPSATSEGVSSGYWCEKIQINSTQNPYEYDSEGTKKEIEERKAEYETDSEFVEYLDDILDKAEESGEYYSAYAHLNLPSGYDHESVPYCKKVNEWLRVVFDAFEHCCLILSKQTASTP